MPDLVIPARFNGPDGSANGGYACGLVAALCERPVAVVLRQPPPLDVPLRFEADGAGGGRVYDGERLIAETGPAHEVEAPPSVEFATATDAMERYPGLQHHAFPRCYVCGTERHDGLGLRPGPVGTDSSLFATRFDPPADTAGSDGLLAAEVIWAALDCPAGWATGTRADAEVVLGTMYASIEHRATPDEPLIVTARVLGGEGRRYESSSALYAAASQRLLARAWSIWIVRG